MEKEQNDQDKKFTYAFLCNGSKYSNCCFDLISKEFFNSSKDFLYLIHIKVKNQNQLPFIKQAESVKSLYEAKLISTLTKEHYLIKLEERNDKDKFSLCQGYELCIKLKADFIFLGYQGSPDKPKTEMTENIKYVINNMKLPLMIIKNYKPRDETGYVWLVCVDGPKKTSRGWAAFEKATYFMKKEDKIICLHIKDGKKNESIIEKEFKAYMESINLKGDFLYDENPKGEKVATRIIDYSNFNEMTPDFITLGHNNMLYHSNTMLESPAVEVLKKADANVFFYTNL